jgi:hypothetical protein
MDIRSGRIGGLVLALALSAAPARAAVLGGSNYAWFGLDAAHYSNDPVAAREPYAVIQNYDTAKTQIDAQLQTMRSNGQTAISIPIFYADGLYNNQVLNASSGDLTAHDKANLTNLIATIKQDGFKQIEYRFDGQYSIAPASWKTWQAAEFQRTWSLIQSLHPLFAAGGVPYLVDLQNEGTPVSNYAPQAQLLAFDKLLWTDYTGTFGTADTVGFSTIADPARIASLGAVYGSTLPGVFDFHLYGPPLSQEDTGALFVDTFNALHAQGLDRPWIIGETFYDDPSTAAQIAAAMATTGQQVNAIYQWPVDRQNRTDRFGNQGVDVAPPLGFDAYLPLTAASSTKIPEPGSFALVAAALASLAALRTIRRREDPPARRRVRPRPAPSRSR